LEPVPEVELEPDVPEVEPDVCAKPVKAAQHPTAINIAIIFLIVLNFFG
jgi:hypothetical protein